MKTAKLQDLGWANSWVYNKDRRPPQVVLDCNHRLERKQLGPCVIMYTCRTCGYRYCVDSGD